MDKEQLLNIFEYKDGVLYWKNAPSKNVKNGEKAGYITKLGYCKIKIKNKAYFAHRLIYMMHYGQVPKILDHTDRNPLNNKIENLRPANKAQNNSNCKIRKDNSSGVKGVNFHKGKWNVRVSVDGKRKNVGSYDDFELAELVSIMAREKYHGNFACHQ